MSAEDIALYEEYLAAQQFEAQYEDELEAMEELEREAESRAPNPKTQNPPTQKPPTPIPQVTPEPVEPFADEDPDLIIDETPDSNKRKRGVLEDSPDLSRILKKSKNDFEPKRTRVLRVPPLECDSVRVSSLEGNLRFLRKLELEEFEFSPTEESGTNLLGKSISDLKAEANALRDEMDIRREAAPHIDQKADEPRVEWTSTYR